EIRTGTQGRNLEAGTDAEAMEECCWLAPGGLLSLISYRNQSHQPRGDIVHMHRDVVLFSGTEQSQAEVLRTLEQKSQVTEATDILIDPNYRWTTDMMFSISLGPVDILALGRETGHSGAKAKQPRDPGRRPLETRVSINLFSFKLTHPGTWLHQQKAD
ncbi:hypothetical protein STEG23_023306, partial [Scotinomys teguina]